MRFFMITTVAASVAVAIAMPAPDGREALCNAGASIPLCCSTDVIGVVDLDCGPPSPIPNTIPDFIKVCAAVGQRARCCALSVAGQGILCSTPV